MSAKADKGQALAKFLAEDPLSEDSLLNDELPHEPSYLVDWASVLDRKDRLGMNFADTTRMNEFGVPTSSVRIMFNSPKKMYIPFSYSLMGPCSNNMTEYTALIMGLELALEAKTCILDVYWDLQLII